MDPLDPSLDPNEPVSGEVEVAGEDPRRYEASEAASEEGSLAAERQRREPNEPQNVPSFRKTGVDDPLWDEIEPGNLPDYGSRFI